MDGSGIFPAPIIYKMEILMIPLRKRFKLEEKIKTNISESLSDDIYDFIQDLHLKDNDLKCIYQLQNNDSRLLVYISSASFMPKYDKFKIGDVEYEVLSLINYLRNINFSLLNVRYRIRGTHKDNIWKSYNIWKTLFDTNPNRWGVKSDPKYIFDVETDGNDFKKTIIDSLELVFEKI